MAEYNSVSNSSKVNFTVTVDREVKARLYELSFIEKLPPNIMLEKIISQYVPTPAPETPGEFKTIQMTAIRQLNNLKPYSIVISVQWNTKLGFPPKLYHPLLKDRKEGKITPSEFQRIYIERLMKPDAQEEIAHLKKLRESHDIYITSFEIKEEGSMRQIFVDFVNGKIVWK